MSLWTSFRDTAVRGVAAYYTGGASEAYYQAKDQAKNRPAPSGTFQTVKGGQVFDDNSQGGRELIATPDGKMGSVVRLAGGMRGLGASAVDYCKRYPQWCMSLPQGMGTILAMLRAGQLPKIKRRRRRGISASDLSKFRRVAGFLHKWGPMCGPGHARAPRKR